MAEWVIEFYEKPNGRCPTEDFLDSLRTDERVLALNSIGQLEQQGNKLDRPHAGYLRDGIHELRIRIERKN